MTIIPYSEARPLIRTGDQICSRGIKIVSRGIRLFRGGEWDLSHIATVIRDIGNEGTGRVELLEALGKGGMTRSYLSRVYKRDHGSLFWLRMHVSPDQQARMMELGAGMIASKIKYDYRTTWLAMFRPIFVDAERFNCSESAWYLLTESYRLARRYDEKGRQIAPIPGDFPTWAGVEPVALDMES